MKKISSYEDYLFTIEAVLEHDKHYYEENQPLISDYEYDQLVKALEAFEKKNPDKIAANSPTKKVSETTSRGFFQKPHVAPMLSLANTYSKEEVDDFIKRVKKLLETDKVQFCCELKMDGTAVSVRYENGKLSRGLTRGNGVVGDDISENIKRIQNLPKQLVAKDIPSVLEIRGEVFMEVANFQKLNEKREEEGLEQWANPRNAAAGSLKLLDAHEVAVRGLKIVLYGIAVGGQSIASQYALHKQLRKWGLPVSDEKHFALCSTADEIFQFADGILKQREKLPFEIDGIVIKVDDIAAHKKLGTTGKSPRYAVAYKFAPEQAFTIIEDITVQVGRTGVLTPVAELKPVHLAGSTISRATLHNQDEIERKDIRIGDSVIIEKGGDVIPKVVSVDLSKRPSNSRKWHMPSTCPVCESKVVHHEGEVAIRCPNKKCPARHLRHLIFFASKQAMDIDHLGEKVMTQLVEKGLVERPSDIYKLEEKDLSELESFKEKSIHNLLNSIEKSKTCSLTQFIMGLEIPYVGKETADLLARNFWSIENIIDAEEEKFLDIEGIGEKVAASLIDYFDEKVHIDEIYRLLGAGVTPKAPKINIDSSHPFFKKTFVLTGSLKEYTRQEASNLIKDKGGKVSSSVSSQTDYVLAGVEPGSKYNKAKKLNIPILSEEEFKKML